MSAIDHTAYFASRLPCAERTHPHPQPAAVAAVVAGDADLFLLALAFARRLQQAEHRFRHIGIADEDPLHRAHVLRAGGAGQRQIGGVEIDDVAARVGDREAVEGMIGDPPHHRIVGAAVGEADDAGGEGEQVEQPDHGEQRQQPENIGLRLRAADRHQRDRDRDHAGRDQQHQHDTASAPRRVVRRGVARHNLYRWQQSWPVGVKVRISRCLQVPELHREAQARQAVISLFAEHFTAVSLHCRRPDSVRLSPIT